MPARAGRRGADGAAPSRRPAREGFRHARRLPAVVAVSAGVVLASFTLGAAPAAAHHVGTYTARDNEVSANFKQLKFAIQSRKHEVALRLFEQGALRKELAARAARLPAGLETAIRTALTGGDGPAAEVALAVFFAAVSRDLAEEADAKLAEPGPTPEARVAAANRFLEAIWRYWNLIDFVVSQRDPPSAVAIRLAFDEAETLAKGTAAPVAANPCAGPRPPAGRGAAPADPARLRPPIRRMAQTLARVVDTLHPPGRRAS